MASPLLHEHITNSAASLRNCSVKLDDHAHEAENVRMTRAPKIVLVIAALLGLFGQTVAVAASPTMVAIESSASPGMPMDCLGMMPGRGDNSTPCDRMTFACIAGMGCSILVTLDAGQPILPVAMIAVASPAWPLMSALEGRSVQPEPHPPCSLA